MTTEVAVLNKLAIALAADSAASIGPKIYNTANKIFDISDAQPFGLMIYNSAEYMGLPFELTAKEFRRAIGNSRFRTVSECSDSFIHFLESEIPVAAEDEIRLAGAVAWQTLQEADSSIEREVIPKWLAVANQAQATSTSYASLVQYINDWYNDRISRLQSLPPARCFSGMSATDVATAYDVSIQSVLQQHILRYPQDAQTGQLRKDLIVEAIYRDELSALRSGVVIAGFGTDELCPSVRWIELDGIFNKKLKWKDGNTITINRGHEGAKILAFAQADIAEMFLTGMSPADQSYITEYVSRQFSSLVAAAKQARGPLPPAPTPISAPPDPLDVELARLVSDFGVALRSRRDQSRARVEGMVRHMPVKELIVLAESLVEITSLRRRVTDDLETVGGAVDVAAITRSEGLVWIKRKHYFESELNARFFMRQQQGRQNATGSKSGAPPRKSRKPKGRP